MPHHRHHRIADRIGRFPCEALRPVIEDNFLSAIDAKYGTIVIIPAVYDCSSESYKLTQYSPSAASD